MIASAMGGDSLNYDVSFGRMSLLLFHKNKVIFKEIKTKTTWCW